MASYEIANGKQRLPKFDKVVERAKFGVIDLTPCCCTLPPMHLTLRGLQEEKNVQTRLIRGLLTNIH